MEVAVCGVKVLMRLQRDCQIMQTTCHFCTDPSNYRKKRYDGFAQFLLEINFNLEDPAEKMYSLDSIPMLATLFGPQVPFHDCRLRIIDSREIATFAIN